MDDYLFTSSSNVGATFGILIWITIIVWTILCVILFFKVWKMCNDIKDLKNHILTDQNFSAKFKLLLEIGETEKAKELLLSRLLSNKELYYGFTDMGKVNKALSLYSEELKRCGYNIPGREKSVK